MEPRSLHETSQWLTFFERTPLLPKLSCKGNPHPDPPPPPLARYPLSPQWHTLGDCAGLSTGHTTFSTQHCQPSNSICLPLSLEAFICMREMSRCLPSMKRKKKWYFPPHCMSWIINLCARPSDTRHAILCAPEPKVRFLCFIGKHSQNIYRFFFLILSACYIWHRSAAYIKDQSVGDKELLLPLTLNKGGLMWVTHTQKKQSGAAVLDKKPKWQINPPSRLLRLFLVHAHLWECHHFTVWCRRIPPALSAPGRDRTCFISGKSSLCFQ